MGVSRTQRTGGGVTPGKRCGASARRSRSRRLAVGEAVILLTSPLHDVLKHLLQDEGGAAERSRQRLSLPSAHPVGRLRAEHVSAHSCNRDQPKGLQL